MTAGAAHVFVLAKPLTAIELEDLRRTWNAAGEWVTPLDLAAMLVVHPPGSAGSRPRRWASAVRKAAAALVGRLRW